MLIRGSGIEDWSPDFGGCLVDAAGPQAIVPEQSSRTLFRCLSTRRKTAPEVQLPHRLSGAAGALGLRPTCIWADQSLTQWKRLAQKRFFGCLVRCLLAASGFLQVVLSELA